MLKVKYGVLVALVLSPVLWAKKTIELQPTEPPATFAEQMQQQSDPAVRDVVLESYINSLLKANAIGKARGKGEISYSVRGYREGQLVVTREEQKAQGNLKKNLNLKVYGVGHSLNSNCSRNEQRCWVLYPNSDNRWLEIAYAPKAIKELEKGMGLLIRELQK
ncbi:hypothetical protein EOPP23_06025 [Endozoicomonas sp. OPT23]|uniref:hypothetical protein n=1 Tax=Endozoicomonas sp. OPT23 TaxID=2072845 RepID=UPI00129A1141|nr:hypothetical protein [Endozoicomonas sp. OPT23]MRI32542.1 hypothetical protein [Endozoicomonas sp. OPT23]